MYLSIFPLWKVLSSFVYVIIYCVGAGITTLVSLSDGSVPYFYRRKMEKAWSVKEGNGPESVYFPQKLAFFLYK